MSTSPTLALPPLPYAADALAPHISADTVGVHYGKHHAAYVANVNRLVAGTSQEGAPLEQIIATASGGLFNNAAQVWNHTFYWHSMHPDGGGEPTGDLLTAVEEGFGSTDGFRKQFTDAACGHFGSGWVWLVTGSDRLEIMTTTNADLPVRHDRTPLLTIDVWEHAYYLDYRNARPAYVDRWIEHLLNWDFAAQNLAGA